MRKNIFLKIGSLAFFLAIVTSSAFSGTLAKYYSNDNFSATARAATFAPEISETETIVLTANGLYDTKDDGLVETDVSKASGETSVPVAPGTCGWFEVEVDNSASEVDISVLITINEESSNAPEDMEFGIYDGSVTDETFSTVYGSTNFATDLPDDSATVDALSTETISIIWRWPFGENENHTSLAGDSMELVLDAQFSQVD